MTDNQDYTQWSKEDLLAEEKKIKKSKISFAFMIGFLVGIMIFGVVKGGFGVLYVGIPVLFIAGAVKNSKKSKNREAAIKAEIGARD